MNRQSDGVHHRQPLEYGSTRILQNQRPISQNPYLTKEYEQNQMLPKKEQPKRFDFLHFSYFFFLVL